MEEKRQQAPGALEHVRAFVNTADAEDGAEELGSGRALGDWLSARGLAPPALRVAEGDLRHAIELREAIRSILLAHTLGAEPAAETTQVLDEAARRADLRVRFGVAGDTSIEPAADGVDAALGRLLAIVHEAISDGEWDRLKACREHTCEWAFYDHTKNHSGAWCNMRACGNRSKARAYRGRRASTST
jgi:predicted RNA-binding Zn ribbon-like protein